MHSTRYHILEYSSYRKFGNKTVTLNKCFVSNQQRTVAFFVASKNNAKFVIFWVPYNPAHVQELKYQITFTDNINLNLLDSPYNVFVYYMEDGEIKKSLAKDEVKNVSYKMFLFILLCLTLFLPVATDIESEIVQLFANLEILFEYNDSHPHFIKCVVIRNNCLPEEIPYLKFLEPPEKISIWSKRNVHLPLSLNKDQFFKEKLTDKKALLSKVEYFINYKIGNQIRSVQFLKFIALIPLALLCVITSCYAKYLIFIIFLALLLLTSFTDARPIEKMSIYENTAPNLHVNHFDCSKMISNQMYSLNKLAPCEIRPDKISTNQARVTLYQRNYKVKLEATMCKATQQQLRWLCDSFDSSGIDARHNTITTSVKPKDKLAKERKKDKAFPFF